MSHWIGFYIVTREKIQKKYLDFCTPIFVFNLTFCLNT